MPWNAAVNVESAQLACFYFCCEDLQCLKEWWRIFQWVNDGWVIYYYFFFLLFNVHRAEMLMENWNHYHRPFLKSDFALFHIPIPPENSDMKKFSKLETSFRVSKSANLKVIEQTQRLKLQQKSSSHSFISQWCHHTMSCHPPIHPSSSLPLKLFSFIFRKDDKLLFSG